MGKQINKLFHTYVGVSQVVDNRRNGEIARQWLEEEMRENNDLEGLNKLEEIGDPPYSHKQYRQFAQIVNSYGGSFDVEMWRLTLISLRASEYSIRDYIQLLDGMNRGGGPLHQEEEMIRTNYIEEIPSVDIPVYFFNERNDYNTSLKLVKEYYEVVDAPEKELVVFEESAHTPFLKERGKFVNQLIRLK